MDLFLSWRRWFIGFVVDFAGVSLRVQILTAAMSLA